MTTKSEHLTKVVQHIRNMEEIEKIKQAPKVRQNGQASHLGYYVARTGLGDRKRIV